MIRKIAVRMPSGSGYELLDHAAGTGAKGWATVTKDFSVPSSNDSYVTPVAVIIRLTNNSILDATKVGSVLVRITGRDPGNANISRDILGEYVVPPNSTVTVAISCPYTAINIDAWGDMFSNAAGELNSDQGFYLQMTGAAEFELPGS